jgi:regulatory protein
LRARALAYLARREYARAELATKLRPHAGPDDDVEALVEDFTRHGWLSEPRLVEQVVTGRKRFGAARLLHDLRRRGVNEALIAKAAAPLRDGELATAREVWAKRFGTLPGTAEERMKQVRFLRSRGFSGSTIQRVLRVRLDLDDPLD